MSASLSVRGLDAGYPGVPVLQGVDLEVVPNSLTALLGPNGAGKTTLLKALAGLIGRGGEVLLDGAALAAGSVRETVQRGLVLVPEGRALFAEMTVRENLELGAYLRPRSTQRAALDRVLALFPRLAERLSQRAGTMSGGEQQMLAIGRALMAGPRLLVLDEPSLGLAPMMVASLLATLRGLPAAGTTVLMVEQNAREALAVADHAYILEHGRIVAAGDPATLARSDRIREAYLGTA